MAHKTATLAAKHGSKELIWDNEEIVRQFNGNYGLNQNWGPGNNAVLVWDKTIAQWYSHVNNFMHLR